MSDVQNLFRKEREDWLIQARATARELLKTRRTITVEDVLKVCPRPSYLHPSVTGSVFKDDDFRPVGFRKSLRPISNSRIIRIWSLREDHQITSYRRFKRRNMEQMA